MSDKDEIFFKVKTFFEDPSNSQDAEFIRGLIDFRLKELEEEREKKALEEKAKKKSPLDMLLGGK